MALGYFMVAWRGAPCVWHQGSEVGRMLLACVWNFLITSHDLEPVWTSQVCFLPSGKEVAG